jgi:type VI secretion system secreted protein VgrG
MAKLVKTTIEIDGTEVRQFYQFSLAQGIFAHHVFKLVCPAEALDGPQGALFSKSRNFIGSSFKIKMEGLPPSGQPLQFTGLITQVEASRFTGHVGDIIISGFSPTIIMDNGPHCNTWEKKAIKNIATDVFSDFPANLLAPQIQPVYGETMAYTVQYKETAWQFLNRIAATYGEWFYYNGQNMVLGTPKPKTAQLVYGSNLSQFSMAMQLRPGNFQQVGYDYINDQVYEASPQNVAQKAGLSETGKQVMDKSGDFFAAIPKTYNNTFLTNKKQLEDSINTRAAAQSSNLVRLNGTSNHFGVQLGNTVNINNNVGDFTVIDVSHHCDGQGNYHNEFIAIPATIKVPPVTNYAEPFCETQTAVVTDNYDPKGLGRIRVRFHWMKPDQKTPWLRMMMPYAGQNKGAFFIPELEEEVVVAFEGNNPLKPYVQGAVYNSSQNTTYSNSNNDIKIIQSRSGHIIELNDAGEGTSITIKDHNGNSIFLDTIGKNITITAPETMTLNAKNMVVNVEENLTTTVGKDMRSTVGANNKMMIAENYTINSKETKEKVTENKEETIGGNLKVKTATTEVVARDGDILLHSAGIATVYGAVDAKVNKG